MDIKCKQQEARKSAHASAWPETAAATGVAAGRNWNWRWIWIWDMEM